tara:strand:+ start:1242 stop:1457 length:216 start_codon:yes stop_codon:yes gene_type:complete
LSGGISDKTHNNDGGGMDYADYMGSSFTIINDVGVSLGMQKCSFDGCDKRINSRLVKYKHTSTFEYSVAGD